MEDIKEHASVKAFAQLRIAKLNLDRMKNHIDDFSEYGTTKDHAIAWAQREYDVWNYILGLIEKDI